MFKIPSNQNQVRFPEEQEVLEAEVSRFEPKGRGTREIETSLEWLAWRRVPRSTPTRSIRIETPFRGSDGFFASPSRTRSILLVAEN